MKKLLVVVSLLVISCTSNDADVDVSIDGQQIEAYSELPPPASDFDVDYTDKECLAEIDRAKSDVDKGILVYTKYGIKIERSEDEFEELLSNYNIAYKPLGENCLAELNCYGYYMNSIIGQRHGDDFIDSMWQAADRLYLSKWATKTYKYWNLENPPKYGNASAEEYILSKLKLPKEWDSEPMLGKRQYLNVEFVVDTSGVVYDIKVGDFSYNLKSTNQNHLGYLKKEIKAIVENMGEWQPAELGSHKVKSWNLLDISLDTNKQSKAGF